MSVRRSVLIVLALVLCGPPVGLLGWMQYSNLTYASDLFAPIPHDQVLATRRWHSIAGTFGCTYAVVRLPQDAAQRPPAALSGRKFPLNMPSEWQETPGPTMSNINMGWFLDCRPKLGDELFGAMTDALEAPGGWWAAGSENIFVYSKTARLAYRLRHGD